VSEPILSDDQINELRWASENGNSRMSERLADAVHAALAEVEALRAERARLSDAVDDALAAGHCGWSGDRLACLVEHCATGHRDRVALREEVARLREALAHMEEAFACEEADGTRRQREALALARKALGEGTADASRT
jgi:hypothetical protein